MKILIINDYSYIVGGAEKTIFDNITLLTKAGHEIFFLGKNKKPFIPLLTGWFSFTYFLRTLAIINKFQPNIVHIHNCIRNISPSPILAAKIKRIPVLMTVHDFNILCPKVWMIDRYGKPCKFGLSRNCFFDNCHNPKMCIVWFPYHWVRIIKLFLQRYLINICVDCFLCPSIDLKKWIEGIFKKTLSIYLPNFLLQNNTRFERKKTGKFFLFVGRLSIEKGVSDLINTFAKIDNEKLVIIGDGPEKDRLEKMVINNKLEKRIKFFGAIKNRDLPKYYSQAIALIVPSIWKENNPLVVLESLSNGTPVIVSNRGGLPDFARNGAVCLVYNNESELINCMQEIKKNTKTVSLPKIYSKQQYQKSLMAIYSSMLSQLPSKSL